jgi:hypothetical protein
MIHSYTVIFGHCISDLDERYKYWQENGLTVVPFSDEQCEESGIPQGSVALGYKVTYSKDRFCPIFLQSLFAPKPAYDACLAKVTDKYILAKIQNAVPQLLLCVDECDCC